MARTPLARALRTIGALVTLTLAVPLVACSQSGGEQRVWVKRMQTAPGVESVEWQYHDNWPTARSYHESRVVVSPQFSVADAEAFARLSCEGGERLDQISVQAQGSGQLLEATMPDLIGSCFDAEQLVRYATALESIQLMTTPESAPVKAFVRSFSPEAVERETPAGEIPLEVHIDSGIEEMFALLQEIQARNADSPLFFMGTGELGNDQPLTVEVPEGYDLAPALTLLKRAFDVPHRGVTLSDTEIQIKLRSERTDDPTLLALEQDAAAAGISLSVIASGSAGTGDENAAFDALLADLQSISGVQSAEAPYRSEDGVGRLTVQVSSEDAAQQALELIISSEPLAKNIEIEATHEPWSVALVEGGLNNPDAPIAFTKLMQARSKITAAEETELVVAADELLAKLSLKDSASKNEVSDARTKLQALIDESLIDSITLSSHRNTEDLK